MGAPWQQAKSKWQANGYAAAHVKAVSSDYYIPQVRPRNYMICVDRRRLPAASRVEEQWCLEMERLKRPASSPFKAFLLPLQSTLPQLKQDKSERQIRSTSNSAETRKYGLSWQARTLFYRCEKRLNALRLISGSKRINSDTLRRHYGLTSELTDREVENYDIFYQRSVDGGIVPGLTEYVRGSYQDIN